MSKQTNNNFMSSLVYHYEKWYVCTRNQVFNNMPFHHAHIMPFQLQHANLICTVIHDLQTAHEALR